MVWGPELSSKTIWSYRGVELGCSLELGLYTGSIACWCFPSSRFGVYGLGFGALHFRFWIT